MLAHDAAHRIDWKILFYTVLGCVVLVDSTAFISFFAIPIGTNDTDVLMQLFTENGVDGVTILHFHYITVRPTSFKDILPRSSL